MYYIQNFKREFKEDFKAKRKDKKWVEFKATWRIFYYIPNSRREFKEGLRPKRKEKKWLEFKSTWRILYYIQNFRREFKEDLKAKKKTKQMRRILIHLKDFVEYSESENGNSTKIWKPKKKRHEENLNPTEGLCITFRIRKWEFKEDFKAKKKRKEMRRI